jgi:hypothetical protein
MNRHQSPHFPSNSTLTATRRRQIKQELRRKRTTMNTVKRIGIYAATLTAGIALGGVLLGQVTAEGDTPGTAATPGATPIDEITPVPVWPTPTPEGGLFVVVLPETGSGSSK